MLVQKGITNIGNKLALCEQTQKNFLVNPPPGPDNQAPKSPEHQSDLLKIPSSR